MSNKIFFGIIAVVIVVVLGGAIFLSKDGDKTDSKPKDVAAVTEDDYTEGAKDPKVTLIEYGDFQCNFCAALHPTLEEVLPEYEDDVQFVFRHFPITSSHPNALVAHKAAEAAGRQDKFWEMHDKLFESLQEWGSDNNPIETFNGYAKELDLDVEQFKSDFDDASLTDRINTVKEDGKSAGVKSTPTMFLNGKKLDTIRSADELRQQLDEALEQAAGNTKPNTKSE